MYYLGMDNKRPDSITIKRIKRLMAAKNPSWSRAELARQAGMDRSSITNILNGNKEATAQSLEKIAVAMGTTVEFLRGTTSNPHPVGGEELPEYALEVLDSMLKLTRTRRYELMVIARSFVADSSAIEEVSIEEFISLVLDYAEETRGTEATDQIMVLLTELQQTRASRRFIDGSSDGSRPEQPN